MTTLAHLLQKDMKTAMSFNDIRRQLQGRVRGLKMKFIDQENTKNWSLQSVFGENNNVAAVLLTVKTPGSRRMQRHWTCLLKLKNKPIQFFDSLALPYSEIDAMLGDKTFTNFLRKIKAQRSTRKLQKKLSGVKTCGPWVCTRAAFGIALNQTNSDFYHFILSEKGTDPDLTCIKLNAIGMLT